jgi:hypothetical protein
MLVTALYVTIDADVFDKWIPAMRGHTGTRRAGLVRIFMSVLTSVAAQTDCGRV